MSPPGDTLLYADFQLTFQKALPPSSIDDTHFGCASRIMFSRSRSSLLDCELCESTFSFRIANRKLASGY
jgi:hypothetical protein